MRECDGAVVRVWECVCLDTAGFRESEREKGLWRKTEMASFQNDKRRTYYIAEMKTAFFPG